MNLQKGNTAVFEFVQFIEITRRAHMHGSHGFDTLSRIHQVDTNTIAFTRLGRLSPSHTWRWSLLMSTFRFERVNKTTKRRPASIDAQKRSAGHPCPRSF